MSAPSSRPLPRAPGSDTHRPCRNFDFKEKVEVDKYYPQFYHKTDKVRARTLDVQHRPALTVDRRNRMGDQYTSSV